MKIKLLLLFFIFELPLIAQSIITFQKNYGKDNTDYSGTTILRTTDGGYIIAGSVGSDSNPAERLFFFLLKTDANGNKIWEKTYGGDYRQRCYSMDITNDGGYILVGWGHGSSTYSKEYIYLVKTDSIGNSNWERPFGGNKDDDGYSVKHTTDDGYIIVGTTSSYGAGICNIRLIKTDDNGSILWQQIFGESGYNFGQSVEQTSDNGFIITGQKDNNGKGDVVLIKTDSAGNKTWEKTFGGISDEDGIDVKQTKDGGYVICGYTYSFGLGREAIYLIKIDSNGNMVWQKNIWW